MTRGICERCKKRGTCTYIKPEGWVLECDEFEEDTQVKPSATLSEKERNNSEDKPQQQ